MKESMTLPRRHLLAGSAAALSAIGLAGFSGRAAAQAAAATAAAAKPLPAYAGWKTSDALIVHSSSTLETKRSAFGTSVITPSNQLYVRNNLPAPDAAILNDRDAWTVAIEGVKNPRSLTLAELKTLGVETVATVLQCSGNGRGFFPSKPSGTPWAVGAAGCVVWSGVPLRNVVAALGGLADGAVYLTGTGGEKLPEGVDPLSVLVERSVPVKATDDALLAWEMNGEPISLAHGGPLRLVVPGYQGVNNIKYVKRVAFTSAQSQARIMSHGYRMSPPGTKAAPDQPSVWEMGVKSWINGPLPEKGTLKAGLVQVHGVAFGGTQAVKGVEVSVDGGKTWQAARLIGPDLGKFAWRQFVLPVQLGAGTHVLASRATDMAGTVQGEQRDENVGGYNNASWRDHAVTITAA
ncbi:sulfite oxidase [Acidovorax sp. LjRoot194]|uniref:SorT family sulfite dehydrogenase catalytic subunit n=1 Tax=Acidovorax sp. LjRoot194 TaxID=3342280 RepID=UPI003ED089B1